MTEMETMNPQAHPAPVLCAQGLHFSYESRPVFNGLSFDFPAGLTWLRGGNGSGKSTLLKLLAGALPAAAGRLSVNGVDEASQPLDYRREVFWCGPGPVPFDHLRPVEYFGFMRGLYPRFDAALAASQAQAFGLQPHLGKRLSALSTGTQRKVWLAAALAAGTSAVLLDEPMNALDQSSLAHLKQALAQSAQDRRQCWVVASHESLGPAGEGGSVADLDA